MGSGMYGVQVIGVQNHTLAINYNATLKDFESIQLYLLFIGDMTTFGVTYGISIFAAAYGVTNFFRIHRERFRNDEFELTDSQIIKMFLFNVQFWSLHNANINQCLRLADLNFLLQTI